MKINFGKHRILAGGVLLMVLGAGLFLFLLQYLKVAESEVPSSTDGPRISKRQSMKSASAESPGRDALDGHLDSSSKIGEVPRSEEPVSHSDLTGNVRPAHWKSALPSAVAPVPAGAAVTPPEVIATVDGRRQLPKFQGSYSDRMEISPKGNAVFSVSWPPEHKTNEILVSTINDGRVNGEAGAVLKRGKDGRFRFDYQAGPHSGATQVVLTAATLSYTLNFWVPTGNPNVDPPALR